MESATGFQKMRRLGIPRTPFRLEDAVARAVAAEYKDMFSELEDLARRIAGSAGYSVKPGTVLVADASPETIMAKLRALMGKQGVKVERLRERLNANLVSAQNAFFRQFMSDVDGTTAERVLKMALDKDEVFQGRIDKIRELYLKDAVKRLRKEEDQLKARFLKKLIDWAEGRADKLELGKLVERLQESSDRKARMFARDEFSKFNRSVLLATYDEAGAPYVEWITVGDRRVRPTHRAVNHRIFTLKELVKLPEYDEENCRCGYAPLYELSAAQKRRRGRP